ncbi:MAG: NUDIX hydrolase [Ancrocorticia sp.]|jgi:ADP-ribose pyrophosphatase|nr:NUDIX hydrolase [Ancrocorticia sp.]MCI1932404.1 NUDIX hydrolase [Ancrocorticia sp.]MCI1962937.1 NUDIX hydrolase [Ancrocorticia sp.]MCI2001305.1 NUDIX hydrolase [Ancrocorticia sp.]MCI2012370.1 NUDIX hydrolase [Ancrocorticia sp.]
MLSDEYAPDHARVLQSAVHYRGAILDTVSDEIELAATGAKMRREYIVHDKAVAILALRQATGGEQVALIRQYRHPVRSILWEIPAGLMDKPGESAPDAAIRELREETDLIADSLEPLVKFWTSPGCSQEMISVFLARDVRKVAVPFTRVDEEAEIEVRWFDLAAVRDAVLAGSLASPSLVNGVLAYYARKTA